MVRYKGVIVISKKQENSILVEDVKNIGISSDIKRVKSALKSQYSKISIFYNLKSLKQISKKDSFEITDLEKLNLDLHKNQEFIKRELYKENQYFLEILLLINKINVEIKGFEIQYTKTNDYKSFTINNKSEITVFNQSKE